MHPGSNSFMVQDLFHRIMESQRNQKCWSPGLGIFRGSHAASRNRRHNWWCCRWMTLVLRSSYKADTASCSVRVEVPSAAYWPLHSVAYHHHTVPVTVLIIIGNGHTKLVLVAVLMAAFVVWCCWGDEIWRVEVVRSLLQIQELLKTWWCPILLSGRDPMLS